MVGPYQLVRELGRGTSGVVYRARRPDAPGPDLAIKLVPDPQAREGSERFLREVSIASRLSHPGLVPVLDHGRGAGFLWYAMELCEGSTLQERLRREGSLAPAEAVALAADLAAALAHAHAQGVVHRDLKPENVVLAPRPRITDFGLARDERAASLTRTGDVLGTPWYMAPEQLLGRRDVDGRADVWALGVILHECLTGHRPFSARNLAEQLELVTGATRPAIGAADPRLPASVDALLSRALAIDPANRPDAATLLAELRALAALPLPGTPAPRAAARTERRPALAVPGAPPRWATPPARPRRSIRWALVAVFCASLAPGAVLGVLLFRRADAPAEVAAPLPSPPPPPPAPPAPAIPRDPAPPAPPSVRPEEPEAQEALGLPRPRHDPPGAREMVAARAALVDAMEHPLSGAPPIRERDLLQALRTVPRHAFARDELRRHAYQDAPLPFYGGRAMAKPSLMAQMIELLALGPSDRVLELGTCSGWQTALLAHLTPAVHSLEPDPQLSHRAAARLLQQGYDRVQLVHGEPRDGWPDGGTFDAILVTGAIEHLPPRVWGQLAIGGRAVFPHAPEPGRPQQLVLLVKRSDTEASQTVMPGVQFHPLPRWR